MGMQKLTSLVLVFPMMVSTLAAPSSPLPRKSPEFTIHQPSGKQIMLSSLKGKVVVLEFLFIQSEHCIRVAKTLNKLNNDLGGRGFQPVAIVFDPPRVRSSAESLIPAMADYLKLTYPVAFAAKTEVDAYLGRSEADVLNIPQVVVIDRTGTIRAQSGGRPGDPKLENEDSLRGLLDSLLNENPPANSPSKSRPASATKTQR
jgi:peroxiredoxin